MISKARSKKRDHRITNHIRHEGCTKCACPILIVEDQKSIANLIDAVIKDRYGYSTILVGSMSEAEKAILEHNIHLAISDLNLPDAPYGEVIDMLSKHSIATIALTGAFGQEMRETILKKGAIDYIPKQSVHSIEYAVEMAHRIYENHHMKVLIVDDAISSRDFLKHVLEKLQFNVITSSGGEEALMILAGRKDIRLALVDYEMPEMNGCELIHEVRKNSSKEELAIIGISGSDSGEMSAQFLKSGANDFVRKPFSYEEILCRIGQNLEVLDLITINREAAYRDYLTGMHNRRYFFQEGARIHSQALKKGGAVAAMIDVDHFKNINDVYGHDCGDSVLKDLADLLSQYFGAHLLARLGGEEFAVVMDKVSFDEAQKLFEKFRIEVGNKPSQYDDEIIPFTVSIGLTNQLGNSIDDFIKEADKMLYKAKSGGRNQVAC